MLHTAPEATLATAPQDRDLVAENQQPHVLGCVSTQPQHHQVHHTPVSVYISNQNMTTSVASALRSRPQTRRPDIEREY